MPQPILHRRDPVRHRPKTSWHSPAMQAPRRAIPGHIGKHVPILLPQHPTMPTHTRTGGFRRQSTNAAYSSWPDVFLWAARKPVFATRQALPRALPARRHAGVARICDQSLDSVATYPMRLRTVSNTSPVSSSLRKRRPVEASTESRSSRQAIESSPRPGSPSRKSRDNSSRGTFEMRNKQS